MINTTSTFWNHPLTFSITTLWFTLSYSVFLWLRSVSSLAWDSQLVYNHWIKLRLSFGIWTPSKTSLRNIKRDLKVRMHQVVLLNLLDLRNHNQTQELVIWRICLEKNLSNHETHKMTMAFRWLLTKNRIEWLLKILSSKT
mgnify:CR=1 FL=1